MPKIIETVSEGKQLSRNLWKIKLISAGQGSSGVYEAGMLEQYGPKAWPKGTKCFADHMTESEMESRPEGSIDRLLGVLETDPIFESDGLYANMRVFDDWNEKIASKFEHIGMSIRAFDADISESGVIEAIRPHQFNSVDVVTMPGAGGKIVAQISESLGTPKPAVEESKDNVVEKEIKEAVDKVLEMLTSLVEAQSVEEDDNTEQEVLDVFESAKVLAEAELPDAALARVKDAVAGGADLAESVTAEQEYLQELTAALKESMKAEDKDDDDKTPRVLESEKPAGSILGRYAGLEG